MPALPNWSDALTEGAGASFGMGRLGDTLVQSVVSGAAANAAITVPGLHPNADIVSVLELRNGLKQNLVTGGAAGNLTLTGIATEDRIVSVLVYTTAASIATVADLTAEFSITAANTINNTGGTSTASNQVVVLWEDVSTSSVDRTAVAKCTAKNTLKLTSATTGSKLLVTWCRQRPDKFT